MRFVQRYTALALATLTFTPLQAARPQTRPDSTTRRDSVVRLETVTVSAIRGGTRHAAPISSKTIDSTEIAGKNFGQDVPLFLQGTPSLTAHSETGSYWGYSYLRLRGIDQTRINLSLDGIPLNDPEDQGLYFADFPDLVNSVSSIQIQRGVGTSAPGTASYGGSINFQTTPLATRSQSGELQLQSGSFGSLRASAEYASGVTRGGMAVSGRVSALRSTGYRRHSGMEGRSGFLSAGHVGERHVLKLTAIAGLLADTMSYSGATQAELAQDRRFNPLRPDETDRFAEQIVGLSYTRYLHASSLSATAYRLAARGNYNCTSQCGLAPGDVWNFRLDFAWYGATIAWNLERNRFSASIGANANTYARDHALFERLAGQSETRRHFNTGHKRDAGTFAKLSFDAGALTVFGDVQGRWARFRYEPGADAGIQEPSPVAWSFLSPKAGATLRVRDGLDVYASYGINSREPARTDMLAGLDNLDSAIVDSVGPLDRVRPERVHDVESGIRLRRGAWTMNANAFAMEFRNEILPVGRLVYGYTPLRTNVRSSWRRGVELDLTATPHSIVELALTTTAMRARIAEFLDEETNTTYRDVSPLLTPSFVTSQRVSLTLASPLTITGAGHYAGRSQLTNTGDPSLRLPATYVVNIVGRWTPKRGPVGAALHVNNVTNHRGFGSGHVSGAEARYYVLPPLNAFLLVTLNSP